MADNSKSQKCGRVVASNWFGVYTVWVGGRCHRSVSRASFDRLARLALPNHDHDNRPVLVFAGWWVNEDNRKATHK